MKLGMVFRKIYEFINHHVEKTWQQYGGDYATISS